MRHATPISASHQNLLDLHDAYLRAFRSTHGILCRHLGVMTPWIFKRERLRDAYMQVDGVFGDRLAATLRVDQDLRTVRRYRCLLQALQVRLDDRTRFFEFVAYFISLLAAFVMMVVAKEHSVQIVYGMFFLLLGVVAVGARMNLSEMASANKAFAVLLDETVHDWERRARSAESSATAMDEPVTAATRITVRTPVQR